MPDLATVTKLINSPPGQFIAGAALAGIVWKFFERVEAVLTDQTKHEIARWLRVRSADAAVIANPIVPWPETFAKVFDLVFGQQHLSWMCFRRSCIASLSLSFLGYLSFMPSLLMVLPSWRIVLQLTVKIILPIIATVAIVPDYLSLLATRITLKLMRRTLRGSVWLGLMCLDIILTFYICAFGVLCYQKGVLYLRAGLPIPLLSNLYILWTPSTLYSLFEAFPVMLTIQNVTKNLSATGVEDLPFFTIYLIPAFFTSIWLWLFAGSGFLLKFMQRFDKIFAWFNRKFDIEKKPLSAIGLVAGSLVAILYWAWAAFRHFVPA